MQTLVLYRQFTSSAPVSRSVIDDAPKNTVVRIDGAPQLGHSRTNIVLIEFSDYECPFCARHAGNVAPKLKEEFVDTGRIRYAFLNNPLPSHGSAKLLAIAAICAGKQGMYWEMHDALFRSKPRTESEIVKVFDTLSGSPTRFKGCLDTDRDGEAKIEEDLQKALRLGLGGTPSFALGRLESDGSVRVEKIIRGAQPLSVFQQAITELF